MDLEQLFQNKEPSLCCRYITLDLIVLINKLNTNNELEIIGNSALINQFINTKLELKISNSTLVSKCMEMKVRRQKPYLIFLNP
jgi:hypothetical protein